MKTIVSVPNPPTKTECKFSTVVLTWDIAMSVNVVPPPMIHAVALTATANFSRSIVPPSTLSGVATDPGLQLAHLKERRKSGGARHRLPAS
jgi:hypothetical protein